MDKLIGTLSGIGGLIGSLSGTGGLSGTLSRPELVPIEVYDGAYDFTPTNELQTIAIQGKKAIANITIQPIPDNYGLITWNGATLTVS